MPPNLQVTQPTSSPSRILPAVAITVVVILIVIGFAWYAKFISFVPAQKQSAPLPPVTRTETAPITLGLGTYALIGRGAGQAENYAGTVSIAKRGTTNNIYDLVWRITSGQAQSGVGILTGNVLSISYYEALDPYGSVADIGVVSYKVTDASHLEGEWTSVLGGRAGIEQLTLAPQL